MNSSVINGMVLCALINPFNCSIPLGTGLAAQGIPSGQASAQDATDKSNYASHIVRVPPDWKPPVRPAATTPSAPNAQAATTTGSPSNVVRKPSIRIELEAPAPCQYLAQACDLPIGRKVPDLTQIGVRQYWINPKYPGVYIEIPGAPAQTMAILHDLRGEAYVHFTPLKIGEMEVLLSSPSMLTKPYVAHMSLTVKEPREQPQQFVLANGAFYSRKIPRLNLTMDKPDGEALFYYATYEKFPTRIQIAGSFVRSRVIATSGGEVVHFDPLTGAVRPVGLGHALLESSYGGRNVLVCLFVTKDRPSTASPMDDCSDLAH